MFRSSSSRGQKPDSSFALIRPIRARMLLALLVCAGVLLAIHARSNSAKSTTTSKANLEGAVTVKAAGRGKSYLNFQDGRRMLVDYRGDENLTQALRSGQAQPRALASADLDGNATPDLIAGYAYNGMGIVTVQRGNPEAFAPKDDSIFPRLQQGYQPPSLLPKAESYAVPEPVDFLVVGDFTGGGHKDVLTAARGGGLYLFTGSSDGTLAVAERINVPGQVTALAAGDFGRTDGRASVLVGVLAQDGPAVLAYESASGGLQSTPERYPLHAQAVSLTLGQLDNDSIGDAMVVTASELDVIHGGGESTQASGQSRVEQIDPGFKVQAATLGDFVRDRDSRLEMALLAADGSLHVLQRNDVDTRSYTPDEQLYRMSHRIKLPDQGDSKQQRAIEWNPETSVSWTPAAKFESDMSATRVSAQALLMTAHVSYASTDDLLALDGASNQLKVITDVQTAQDAALAEFVAPTQRAAVPLDVNSAPIAVLPLPIKLNGARDLIVLNDGQSMPTIVPILPAATVTVNSTPDVVHNAAGQCALTGTGTCSLRDATIFANANTGTVISINVGTYQLTIDGNVEGGNCTDATIGDLDLSKTTTITGAGSATTIIQQTKANDRVFCLDQNLVGGLTYNVSGVTISGGRETHGICGGGICTGSPNDNTVITNCVISNNQVPAHAGSPVGGGVANGDGSLTITGSTIGGTTTVAACPSQTDLTCGNSAGGSGGGVYENNTSTAGATFSMSTSTFQNNVTTGNSGGAINVASNTGTFATDSITTCVFTSNQAQGASGRGGAIRNESGGSMTIGKSTFLTNQVTNATGNGGAVASADGAGHNVTMSFSRLVGNTAATGNNGQAVWGGSSSTMTIDNNWWGINTGPDTTCTGSCDAGGTFTLTVWLQLRNTLSGANVHNGNQIAPSTTATFSADILGLSTSGSTSSANLTGIALFPSPAATVYDNAVLGTVPANSFQYTAGVAPSITYTAGATKGTGSVRATADNQQITTNVIVGFTPEWVNPSGGNDVPSAFASAACGAGNTPCFNTIALALFNVAPTGIIHIQAGTYAESPNFNQSCTGNIDGAVNLTGSLTISTVNDTVNGNAQTLSLTGDFTKSAGTFNPNTGTVTFNGGGTQTITNNVASLTFNNFVVNKSGGTLGTGANPTTIVTNDLTMTAGSFTAPATLNINGNTTLTAGTLTAGTNISAAGNWTNNGGTFTPGSGTITFNGAGAQAINGTAASQTFNNFVVNKGNTLSTGGSTTTIATNDLTMTAGTFTAPATLNINGNTLLTAGTLTAGTAITAAGNWTNNGGTFTPGAGTVTFNGAGAQAINGTAASQTFNNFTVNKSANTLSTSGSTVTLHTNDLTMTLGSFTAPATLDINGNVLLTAGTLTAGTNITAAGNWTNNGGTFTPGSNTVTFDGAGAQAINGTATPQGFFNLTVGKSTGTLTSGIATLNVGGTFLLNTSGGTFAQSTSALNVTGDLTANLGTTFTKATGGQALTFNNTSSQNWTDNTAAGQDFGNVVVGGTTNTVTMQTAMKMTALTVNSGDTLFLNTKNFSFSAAAAPTNNGTIRLAGNETLTNVNNLDTAEGLVEYVGRNLAESLAIKDFGATDYFNLSINDAHANKATFTLGAAMTLNGSLSLTSGTLSPGSNGINLSGNWTNNGGTFTPGTSIVTFQSTTGAQSIGGTAASQTFNSIVVNKTGQTLSCVSSTTTLGLNANFTITAGTFDIGTCATVNVQGNWSNSGTFTPGTGTVAFTGTGAGTQTISGTTSFKNLTINHTGGGGVSASGSTLSVTGLLHVVAGTFTSATSYVDVTIDSGATLAGTSSTTIDVSGNWTNNGTYTANTNTVNFNGSGAQTIGGSSVTTFNSLTIANGGSGISLGQNETVNGTLTLTNDLNTSTFTLTQPSTAPASLGTGDVVGSIKRTGAPLPTTTLTYGNPNNTIGFTGAGTNPTDITVKLTKATPTDAITGQTNSGFPGAILRTYVITPTGGLGFSATMQLHYNAGDLNSNTNPLRLWKFITSPTTGWQQQLTSTDSVGVGVSVSGIGSFSPWTMASVSPSAANGNVSGQIVDNNGNPVEGAAVRMSGTQNRLTVTDAQGNYRFENVETNGLYTVVPTRANYSFSPTQRSFSQLGQHTEAAFSATATGGNLNPLDTTEYFVRQQYVDFLGREPDEAGFNFWVNDIESCGADQNCRAGARINTSGAFFLSIEFQQTGFLVYRTYQAAYGDLPNEPVPIRRSEFRPDTAEIGNGVVVLQSGWEQNLENNKQAFMTEFVQRARFLAAYPTTMTPGEFVDKLFANASVVPTALDRTAAIDEFGNAGSSADVGARARALRRVAENSTLVQREFNQAFVLMQYFGYLQRDPNTGPDTDFTGYNYWLNKLNSFNGNFQNAEMVNSFLVSSEYRGRFPH